MAIILKSRYIRRHLAAEESTIIVRDNCNITRIVESALKLCSLNEDHAVPPVCARLCVSEHSDSRFESIRLDSNHESIRFVKKNRPFA